MAVITLEELGLSNEDLTAIGKLSETALTPQQIADNIKYGVRDFINTDTAGLEIKISDARQNWTKGLTAFTGILAIEITGIYNNSNLNSLINIEVLPTGVTKKAKDINITCNWNNSTDTWTSGFADDILNTELLTVRFAKNTTTNKMYILLGELATVWTNTRIKVSIPMSSVVVYNVGFDITKLTSLTGITTDITKTLSVKIDNGYLGTLSEFTANLN